MRGPSAGHGDRVAASRLAQMARRSAATVGRLAVVETGSCSAGGTATGCLPCTLAEGGAGEMVAVAVMEPDASRLTETVPDAVVMDAEPAPSLLTVAVAVGGGGVAAADAVAAEAAAVEVAL